MAANFRPWPIFGRGFATGVLLACLPWALYVLFLQSGRGALVGGKWAEEFTRDELKVAKRRGWIWAWLHNIEVQNMDIDHVVLAPAGVIAVETKWHYTYREAVVADDARRAELAAAKLRSILRSTSRETPPSVQPLVVIWGPSQAHIPGGKTVNGVLILAGSELRTYLKTCTAGPIDGAYAKRVASKLRDFQDRVRPQQRVT